MSVSRVSFGTLQGFWLGVISKRNSKWSLFDVFGPGLLVFSSGGFSSERLRHFGRHSRGWPKSPRTPWDAICAP